MDKSSATLLAAGMKNDGDEKNAGENFNQVGTTGRQWEWMP
jgi:hypothetical protein